MSGKLIVVCGISGAGKSTLIRNALDTSPQLEFMKTYTTRPRRDGEDDSEYNFISETEYDRRLAESSCWEGGEMYGYRYGEDVTHNRSRLTLGRYVITCCHPSLEDVEELYRFYPREHASSIYIDTPKEIAAERLVQRGGRTALNKIASDAATEITPQFISKIDYILSPAGSLNTDCLNFNKIISKIIHGAQVNKLCLPISQKVGE